MAEFMNVTVYTAPTAIAKWGISNEYVMYYIQIYRRPMQFCESEIWKGTIYLSFRAFFKC